MKFMLLPWKPELVFTGTSVMGVNPENGKFCSHVVGSKFQLSSSGVIYGYKLWFQSHDFCIVEKSADATLIAVALGYRHIKNLDATDFFST